MTTPLPPLLLRGDCLVELTRIPDASVDAVVTDPPYGLDFMGKGWDNPGKMLGQMAEGREKRGALAYGGTHSRGYADHNGLAFERFCEAWAAECLRILKPGGHLLAFGGSRTWHRLAAGIEDAGFEIRDSIAWLYGSGFPKSLDVSKAIDAHLGGKREPDVLADREGVTTNTAYGKGLGVDIISRGRAATSEAAAWDGWGTALKPARRILAATARRCRATSMAQAVRNRA